jgi:uncharacterized membrane-anchored protein YhcB (DUF1043 family)
MPVAAWITVAFFAGVLIGALVIALGASAARGDAMVKSWRKP